MARILLGIPLAALPAMPVRIWVSDREAAIRALIGELLPESDILLPDELQTRLGAGVTPDALVIDGTQLLELPARQRRAVLRLPRVLICTGLPLTSLPMSLISGPAVAVLAKPFCVEDLEAAVEWLRGTRDGSGAVPHVSLVGSGSGARPPQSPVPG